MVVVNKWDRVPAKAAEDMDAYKADVKAQLRAVGWAQVVCTMARYKGCMTGAHAEVFAPTGVGGCRGVCASSQHIRFQRIWRCHNARPDFGIMLAIQLF